MNSLNLLGSSALHSPRADSKRHSREDEGIERANLVPPLLRLLPPKSRPPARWTSFQARPFLNTKLRRAVSLLATCPLGELG